MERRADRRCRGSNPDWHLRSFTDKAPSARMISALRCNQVWAPTTSLSALDCFPAGTKKVEPLGLPFSYLSGSVRRNSRTHRALLSECNSTILGGVGPLRQ